MSRRDDGARLADMLEHARLAMDLMGERKFEAFEGDRHVRAGIERYVEVIGEAARHVGDEARSRLPEIPWRQVIATRNIVAHGYDVVRPDVLWDVVHKDLPPLIEAIERILQEND